ncbi:GNAT family N-acetyltransferase [Mucilaginibacter aquaedulcis]|uniref:GNAT family N-acetyltransferase n=1 Tax=Mucilaginibacter aquaedulcis TaxID=1187081 RepID=UPI0025B5DC23|nr:GNAT family N-acetyltransferase [Mucilaginibacter aquaedulcis]MDN3548719.1 GNAT family N-acetyltransferase [Mucilaginibacter aquaedulcis]
MKLPVYIYGLWFRMVEETDAEFIWDLRTNPELARHLSPIGDHIDNQRTWIRNYKTREAKRVEYYFIFGPKETDPCGVIRLYNITADAFTCGSWLIRPRSDEFAAPGSDLFAMILGFETLNKQRCIFDTRKANKKVVRYHRIFAKQTHEDRENYYFEIDWAHYQYKKHFLSKILGII